METSQLFYQLTKHRLHLRFFRIPTKLGEGGSIFFLVMNNHHNSIEFPRRKQKAKTLSTGIIPKYVCLFEKPNNIQPLLPHTTNGAFYVENSKAVCVKEDSR